MAVNFGPPVNHLVTLETVAGSQLSVLTVIFLFFADTNSVFYKGCVTMLVVSQTRDAEDLFFFSVWP